MPQSKRRRVSSSELASAHEPSSIMSQDHEIMRDDGKHKADIDVKARREVYLDTYIPGVDVLEPPLCHLSDNLCNLCCNLLRVVLTDRSPYDIDGHWTYNETHNNFRTMLKHHSYRQRLENSSREGCELCSLLLKALPIDQDHEDSIVLSRSPADSEKGTSLSKFDRHSFSFTILPKSLLRKDNCTRHVATFHFIVAKNMGVCLKQFCDVRTIEHPWINIPKLPRLDPYSRESFDQIRRWYKNCSSDQHFKCDRLQEQLPKRLLDVFAYHDGQIKRRHRDDNDNIVSLVETKSMSQRSVKISYLALSYCWGDWSGFVTETTNLADMNAGVCLNKLPQVVQDAVYVCRQLNIRYLWVDSLCICQDDSGEIDEEIGRMEHIYGGCAFMVSALCSSTAGEGFLKSRGFLPVHLGTMRSSYGTWSEDDELFVCQTPRSAGDEIALSPLSERAWTLQEKLMALVVLHYGRDQIMWECNTGYLVSETGQSEIRNEKTLRISTSTEISTSIGQRSLWECLVEEFSKRKLTYNRDKLPAMSGIMSALHNRGIVHGRYAAGLWEDDLDHQLMWRSDDIIRASSSRLTSINADIPTWSWVHLNHPVSTSESTRCASALSKPAKFQKRSDRAIKARKSTSLLDFRAICLSGFVQSVRIASLMHDSLPDANSSGRTFFPGLPGTDSIWWSDTGILPHGEYFAIRVLHCPRIDSDFSDTIAQIMYLVLRRANCKVLHSREDRFVRVGVLYLYQVEDEHFTEPYPDVVCKTGAPLLVDGTWRDIVIL